MYTIYKQPLTLRACGLNYEHWRSRVHPDDVEQTEAALKNAVAGRGIYNPIFRLLLPDGEIRYIRAGAIVEKDIHNQTTRVVGFNLDITAQYEQEMTLQHDVMTDALTGLENRRFFEQECKIMFESSKRTKTPLALMMIDVDSFKKYNDQYGHQAGDDCLKRITQAMKKCLRRPTDLIARYGGEEFVCLLPDTDAIGAMHVAKKLLTTVEALKVDHKLSEVLPNTTISIGLAIYQSNNFNSVNDLIKNADINLYTAKTNGRNRVIGPD